MFKNAIFFDAKDYELLKMINMILERDHAKPEKYSEKLLDPNLHPHGIKELALSPDKRIAYAVINLLESLEIGLAEDRLAALRSLHDEVLYGPMTNFRYNTARVLIQIMKEILRAHGNFDLQIRLAHDFRSAISGKRRIVRELLKRYFLLEMPESWDQLAFDHHVHDANTKGRKSPTHLIMDAWIKGIRTVTIIYYNYVQPGSVQELMRAARIMAVKVNIAVEYKTRFRGRYIDIMWQPDIFADHEEMLDFLNERPTMQLMQFGEEASRYQEKYVFSLVDRYNEQHRVDIEKLFSIKLPRITREGFVSFVGIGQPSVLHLAELVYKTSLPERKRRLTELETELADIETHEKLESSLNQHGHQYMESEKEREGRLTKKAELERKLERLSKFDSDEIQETWLSKEFNSDLPDPAIPRDSADVPEIMRIPTARMVDWLYSVRNQSTITLSLAGLKVEDVLEILYDCEGMIKQLELVNLKYYNKADDAELKAINKLTMAINEASSIELKRLIHSIINDYSNTCSSTDERCQKFTEILKNIQKLKNYYRMGKLRSSIGSDSTSRSHRVHGMGFVCLETLPPRAQKEVTSQPRNGTCREILPLYEPVSERITYRPRHIITGSSRLASFLRRQRFLRNFTHIKFHDWVVRTDKTNFSQYGNISTLGGVQKDDFTGGYVRKSEISPTGGTASYLNSTLRNVLKVLIGLTAAIFTFQHTQTWWVLAWFGPFIWFGITGLRNIIQAVLGTGGLRRSPLLRWNNFVSWSRLADSLMYTGFSVPILELGVRVLLLQNVFHLTPQNSPWVFFTIMSVVNGLYISSHNIYRGLPTMAIVGNLFRSAFAIPVAIAYNQAFEVFLVGIGISNYLAIMTYSSSIISKISSDTIAGIIEGLADKSSNMRIRYGDYQTKIQHLFALFSKLEILLPEKHSVLELLTEPKNLPVTNSEQDKLERKIIIDALDLMYFWMYQPRGRHVLKQIVPTLSQDEREILCKAQLVLARDREVSQLFVDGVMGRNFAKPLAFYLAQVRTYLKDLSKTTGVPIDFPE